MSTERFGEKIWHDYFFVYGPKELKKQSWVLLDFLAKVVKCHGLAEGGWHAPSVRIKTPPRPGCGTRNCAKFPTGMEASDLIHLVTREVGGAPLANFCRGWERLRDWGKDRGTLAALKNSLLEKNIKKEDGKTVP